MGNKVALNAHLFNQLIVCIKKTYDEQNFHSTSTGIVKTRSIYRNLPYPILQFSEEWVRGRRLMACLTP